MIFKDCETEVSGFLLCREEVADSIGWLEPILGYHVTQFIIDTPVIFEAFVAIIIVGVVMAARGGRWGSGGNGSGGGWGDGGGDGGGGGGE